MARCNSTNSTHFSEECRKTKAGGDQYKERNVAHKKNNKQTNIFNPLAKARLPQLMISDDGSKYNRLLFIRFIKAFKQRSWSSREPLNHESKCLQSIIIPLLWLLCFWSLLMLIMKWSLPPCFVINTIIAKICFCVAVRRWQN